MTGTLRLIGYWDGEWPDVCGFLSETEDPVRASVAAFLRSGRTLVASPGFSVCRLCGARNGSTDLTDGSHFVWPSGLAHYVEDHGVRLPEEVVARSRGPIVDPGDTDDVTVDGEWWRDQAVDGPVTHRLGCPRNPGVAGWDLPPRAEIWVDGIPPDATAVLVGVRRLLGAAWPFAGLREQLKCQPFRAVAGNPAELHRSLSARPELRPYLFYGTEHDLRPIWA
ncbi:hypothetical protein Aab01nite_53020 [Paractinoplanes abujensis]|uniref:Uncharacterized protein n=1 Tax=Paractinoplanes abujensis TaxID=882441 RepID=A0A7W7CRY1_9ACTN|nr:hypothetical protein [Actinoplanes abujensis]MBB4693630.1 hypothetical protein [Actinoplanes abujensis]GID21712.1 hypothetical protein Aab01nite_53020 [Actinoplanes abujensis]